MFWPLTPLLNKMARARKYTTAAVSLSLSPQRTSPHSASFDHVIPQICWQHHWKGHTRVQTDFLEFSTVTSGWANGGIFAPIVTRHPLLVRRRILRYAKYLISPCDSPKRDVPFMVWLGDDRSLWQFALPLASTRAEYNIGLVTNLPLGQSILLTISRYL